MVEMNGWWHCGGPLTPLSEAGSGVGALGLVLQGREALGGWHFWPTVVPAWEGWAELGAGGEPGIGWGQAPGCVAPGMLPWVRAFLSTAVSVWAQENTRGKKGSGCFLRYNPAASAEVPLPSTEPAGWYRAGCLELGSCDLILCIWAQVLHFSPTQH